MKRFMRLITTLVVLTLFYLIFPRRAYAYLDPGTGSYIVQLLIAASVGLLFATRLYWNKIKTFFKNLLSGGHEEAEEGKKHEKAED